MVLPAELRRELGLAKGDKVVIETDGDTIVLSTPERSRRQARELFRRYVPEGRRLVDELIADRRAEAARDQSDDERFDRSAAGSAG